jgi:RND family efflux transporter MFP subunit
MIADREDVETAQPQPLSPETGPIPTSQARPTWGLRGLALLTFITAGIGGVYVVMNGKLGSREPSGEHAAAGSRHAMNLEPRVEVVQPKRGGMQRTTNQPATIRAFDYAPLYAKVSGYLDKLNVDRGSRVKAGQLLLEVFDPELDAAVAHAKAELEHSHAAVAQATERIKVAEAFARAAQARQDKAVADLETATAARVYRKLDLDRITELVERKAVEPRLKDEKDAEYHTAVAAEHAAQAAIETAKAEYQEALSRIDQAKADLVAARADIKLSEATLAKARVFLDYTKLNSPSDGVVIFRGEGVHPGAFIQSAVQGTGEPLLTVARDEKLRTTVLVPDPDVPYCDVGDPAIITLDALGGRTFKGVISRMAESEDIHDRNMRVEVDLDNPDHVLRHGMWGRCEIILEGETKNLTVPSSCLIDRNAEGEGTLLLVKDSKVHRAKVHIGRDNGLLAEIVSGLEPDSQVVLQPDVSTGEGTKVRAESAASSSVDRASQSGRP